MAATTGLMKRHDDRVMISKGDCQLCLYLRRLKNKRGVRGQFSYRNYESRELEFDSVELTAHLQFCMNEGKLTYGVLCRS